MHLCDTDVKKFYKIWFHLLDYTNSKYNIVPHIPKIANSGSVNPEEIAPIRDRLWADDTLLTEFVEKNPFKFDSDELSIVSSWKNRVNDKFILLKHLKNYSIFMGNQNIYGVTGIVTPINEMFPTYALPLMVATVILPFENKIIYDSLMIPYNIRFGGGAKNGFSEEYRELKQTKGIVTSLNL